MSVPSARAGRGWTATPVANGATSPKHAGLPNGSSQILSLSSQVVKDPPTAYVVWEGNTCQCNPSVRAGDQVPVDGRDGVLGQRRREPLPAVQQPVGDHGGEAGIGPPIGERALQKASRDGRADGGVRVADDGAAQVEGRRRGEYSRGAPVLDRRELKTSS
jgi:hypothetical protein